MFAKGVFLSLVFLITNKAAATPSSTYWAPSTASCQAWAIPHVTYDTYFRKGPGMNSGDANAYPADYGLTVGVLPFEKIQAEIGYDMLLPSENPDYINGKICTPESSLFEGSPAISFGIYGVGFKKNISDYNIVHLMLQKSLPVGGYIAIGGYHGFNKTLFANSDGNIVQMGVIFAVTSADIQLNRKGLKKINFAADIQTGKNSYGAWGFGVNIFFADNVSMLTGPVFFLDRKAQPGGSDILWALQLDIDVPLEPL